MAYSNISLEVDGIKAILQSQELISVIQTNDGVTDEDENLIKTIVDKVDKDEVFTKEQTGDLDSFLAAFNSSNT